MGQDDNEAIMLMVLIVGLFIAHRKGLLQPLIEKLKTLIPIPGAPGGGAGAGGAGGPISPGGSCPPGETCKLDDQGRYDCMKANFDSYEATWCGTFSGDDLTIKMYGPPHHNDGDCCWCVIHVKEDGSMVAGGEGPHPDSNCEHPGSSKGGKGKATCYKGVMRPGPIQEGYALVNGKWELRASYKGPCGCDKKSSTRTGSQLTFRCDGNFKTTCATVKALGGGAAPTPAKSAYAPTQLVPELYNTTRIAMSSIADDYDYEEEYVSTGRPCRDRD